MRVALVPTPDYALIETFAFFGSAANCGRWLDIYYRLVADIVLPLSIMLYVGLPCWMLVRGWPFRAGLTMVGTALLPWCVWLTTVSGRLGPGAGIVMMLTAAMLLAALIPLTIGIILRVRRFVAETCAGTR